MNVVVQPWQLLWAIFAGFLNELARRRIDYLQSEVEASKEAFGPKRILPTDD